MIKCPVRVDKNKTYQLFIKNKNSKVKASRNIIAIILVHLIPITCGVVISDFS